MERNIKWIAIFVILFLVTSGAVAMVFFSHLFSAVTLFTNPSGNTLLTKISPQGTSEWEVKQQGLVYPQMIPAAGNGYVIYGSTTFPDSVLPSLKVTKIRPDGQVAWDVTKSPQAYYPEIPVLGPASFLFPDESGYTVIDNSGAMIRLDDQGREQWHRYYYGNVREAIRAEDGGYLLAGTSYYRNPPSGTSSESIGWIVKLDAAGNKTWEYPGHEYRECSSLNTSAGGIVRASCTRSSSKDLVSLDETGKVTTVRPLERDSGEVRFSETDSQVSFHTKKTGNGSIHIILGNPRGSLREMTIEDSVSHLEIRQTYGILPTEDGGYLVFSSVP